MVAGGEPIVVYLMNMYQSVVLQTDLYSRGKIGNYKTFTMSSSCFSLGGSGKLEIFSASSNKIQRCATIKMKI
jgi:hypothetical protein